MLLVITNRRLCQGDFFERIEEIAQGRPEGIILREKDLGDKSLLQYAKKCNEIAKKYGVLFGINASVQVAKKLELSWLHLSVEAFRNYDKEKCSYRKKIGVSIHSVEEAIEMECLGASYLIAGHIFPTNCKKGMPARGLDFLKMVCKSVSIPVYAIGGITKEKKDEVIATGAAGFCVMSQLMECENPRKEVEAFIN